MSCIKLASAGDDIKIWDIGDFSLVKQFNPHEQNVSAIAWNGKKSACESILDVLGLMGDEVLFTVDIQHLF